MELFEMVNGHIVYIEVGSWGVKWDGELASTV
jgi:hypothetical protein